MADQPHNERAIFLGAIEIASSDERRRYLDEACGGNDQLRAEVEALLEEHDHEQPLLDVSENAVTIDRPVPERAGTQVGPYKLLQEIGEGGMGVVYLAEQRRPVRRKVALKIIKPGMDTKEVIARFEAERQTLALMDHPNIAHVLDAGTTDRGRPYFVMELAQGVPLSEYCDQNRFTIHQRLGMFATVCQAVHHAHQKGIIHRDLKPSNILVTLHDGNPLPKIIDFGIAKVTNRQLTDQTMFTSSGQMVGTPLYMSPEQGDGTGLDVDVRSDIYSLGVVLYELLTGTTPFDRKLLRDVGLDEYRRRVRDEEPLRPSSQIVARAKTTIAASAHRMLEPQKVSRLLKRELDWIVMKSLEKDRTRRYETANDLARDIDRYLNDAPVEACPPSAAYRLHKFTRRYKRAVVGALTIALALMVGAAAATGQAIRASRAEGQAQEQIELANRQRQLAVEQQQLALRQKQLASEAGQREKGLRTLAEQAARQAENETKLAEANLRLALEALDGVYLTVSEKRLPQKMRLDKTDQELLSKALTFYERFAEQNRADLKLGLETAKAYRRVGKTRCELGRYEQAEQACRQAIKLLEKMVQHSAADTDVNDELATCLSCLGEVTKNIGRFGEAEEALQRALELRRLPAAAPDYKLTAQQHLARAYVDLGDFFRHTLRASEADSFASQAIDTLGELDDEASEDPRSRHVLAHARMLQGCLLFDLGKYELAESLFRSTRIEFEKLISEFPSVADYRADLASNCDNLGRAAQRRSINDQAENCYRESVAHYTGLADEYPGIPHYRSGLATGYVNLASALVDLNKNQEAEQACREATDILDKLADKAPGVAEYGSARAKGYSVLAAALNRLNRRQEAEQAGRKAISTLETLVEQSPNVASYRASLAIARRTVGNIVRYDRARGDDAVTLVQRSVDLLQQLSHQFPDHEEYSAQLAFTYRQLAIVLGSLERKEGRYESYRKAIQVYTRLLARNPQHKAYRAEIGRPLNNVSWQMIVDPNTERDVLKEALEMAERAVEYEPTTGFNWNTLGVARYRLGVWQGAIEALQKSLGMHEQKSFDLFFLAMAHWQLGKPKQARDYYDQAVSWMDTHAPDDAELIQFRAEAKQLLDNGSDKPSKSKEATDNPTNNKEDGQAQE